MARRDLTGAVDFTVLEAMTGGMDDITEDNTTRFMIIAAEATPACEKIFTNGLTLGLIWSQGVTHITTNSANT